MEITFLWKGALVGFAVAAPVGPIALICIRRTLHYGRLSGLFSGLGAATADAIFAAIAIFGLGVVSDFLFEKHFWLRLVGGAFLVYLGARTFALKTEISKGAVSHKTLIGDFFSTLALTLTNPMTIVSFIAIFGGIGMARIASEHFDAYSLVTGVFIGSAFWWLLLSEGITLFRQKVSQTAMCWINRIAGILIALFGVAAWLTLTS